MKRLKRILLFVVPLSALLASASMVFADVTQGLQAFYIFNGNAMDSTHNSPDMTLNNTGYTEVDSLELNGVYDYCYSGCFDLDLDPETPCIEIPSIWDGQGYKAIATVPGINFNEITVSVDFYPTNWNDIKDGLSCGHTDTILVMGSGYRWLKIEQDPVTNKLRVGLNNFSDFSYTFVDGPDLTEFDTHYVRVSIDFVNRTMNINLDGIASGPVTIDSSFVLDHNFENDVMFTNYSNAGTFEGDVDNLMIYNRALSAAELAEIDDDIDNDDFSNDSDNCPIIFNPLQTDSDVDGVGDACDNCPNAPNSDQLSCNDACATADKGGDSDDDGICNTEDNCPGLDNPSQADYDDDGVGDVCDNCPSISNGTQSNDDGDEMGDLCDPCLGDSLNICDQFGQADGLTATVVAPGPIPEVEPLEPVILNLCEQNPGPEPVYAIFDCFTASYELSYLSPTGEPVSLPTKHKDRVAYLIGTTEALGDVKMIPPGGQLCIPCDVKDGVEMPSVGLYESINISGDVCSTNYITDPNIVDGACTAFDETDPGNPIPLCLDIKTGTVCAPLAFKAVNGLNETNEGRVLVQIDIKPGSDQNTINLGSNGKLPVAILSESGFDATALEPMSVLLADAGVALKGKSQNPMTSNEDVNGDGLLDLVVFIETEGLQLTNDDVSAKLTAEVRDAGGNATRRIYGVDTIRVVPAN